MDVKNIKVDEYGGAISTAIKKLDEDIYLFRSPRTENSSVHSKPKDFPQSFFQEYVQ